MQASQDSLHAVQEANRKLASITQKIAGTEEAIEEGGSIIDRVSIDQQSIETQEELAGQHSPAAVDAPKADVEADQEVSVMSDGVLAKLSIEAQLEALAPTVGKYTRYCDTEDYDASAKGQRTDEELRAACVKAKKLIARVRS